jgi:hypothetical protein
VGRCALPRSRLTASTLADIGISSKKSMSYEFILVDLSNEQKIIVLDKASFYLFDEETKMDLNNKRKKWIRFKQKTITDVIGELSYYYNRSRNKYESMLLDELICHLEYYEKHN